MKTKIGSRISSGLKKMSPGAMIGCLLLVTLLTLLVRYWWRTRKLILFPDHGGDAMANPLTSKWATDLEIQERKVMDKFGNLGSDPRFPNMPW